MNKSISSMSRCMFFSNNLTTTVTRPPVKEGSSVGCQLSAMYSSLWDSTVSAVLFIWMSGTPNGDLYLKQTNKKKPSTDSTDQSAFVNLIKQSLWNHWLTLGAWLFECVRLDKVKLCWTIKDWATYSLSAQLRQSEQMMDSFITPWRIVYYIRVWVISSAQRTRKT